MTEEKYWLWLSSLNIMPDKKLKLVLKFKDAYNLWNANERDIIMSRCVDKKDIKKILSGEQRQEAEILKEKVRKAGSRIISINDSEYPEYLKNISDAPVVLYIRGKLKKDEKYIAIVGSRRASWYGIKETKKIAYNLAEKSIAIVSGMARGIDTSAHKGALEGGGRTVAVLGCGIDIIYPYENKALKERIEKNGAVITEYPPGTKPLKYNFPARNRIISGLSLGVVVAEAGMKSGSLITVEYALEQGREVFAMPGNINKPQCMGTNKLIKDGAAVLTCLDDIINEIPELLKLKNIKCQHIGKNKLNLFGLDKKEQKILKCLLYEPVHINNICEMTGFELKSVSSVLLMLELKAAVKQLPGRYFVANI